LTNTLINTLIKLGILKEDLDYHLIRAAMVIIFFFLDIEMVRVRGERLIPAISAMAPHLWLYPALGMRGATWFWAPREWTFGTLLFMGFWNKSWASRGARLQRHLHHGHDHPIHARWLGRGCGRFRP
jgi:hypothetical protein